MTRKNDKYALHAKRRIRSNGENFTVSPYAPNKESVYIRDITKSIEKLRSSNDPDDKELLEILIKWGSSNYNFPDSSHRLPLRAAFETESTCLSHRFAK